MDELRWRPVVEADQEEVLTALSSWSDGPDLHELLPRFLFGHFSDTSLIVEDADGDVAGFIISFVSQSRPETGYLHLVWVSPERRLGGLAREMYTRVFALLRGRGCTRVEAVTSPSNAASLVFHEHLGFTPVPGGQPAPTAGQAGTGSDPSQDRVTLERPL
ncbi:MAG: GNAT family N-acetyltransferase [Candidatus Nanopelagicales bacterium]